jgi:ribosomal RNA-processing protein 8
MFAAYHQGFREQTKEWPVRPLDLCVRWLRTQPSTAAVADFGCGDAELARAAPQTTVHSFDLESDAPGVVACNMAQVPLPDASVEVAVFSLSLMAGTSTLNPQPSTLNPQPLHLNSEAYA